MPAGVIKRLGDMARARDQYQSQAETLQSRVQELEAQLKTAQSTAQQTGADLALAEAGLVDREARVVARALHQSLPEDDRPGLADWVASLRESPDDAPRSLRAYLQPDASSTQTSSEGSQTQEGGQGLPSSRASVQSPPPATSAVDALDAAQERMKQAMASGDAEALASARSEVTRQLSAVAKLRVLR